MATINPYVDLGGNAEEAFSFYKSVFGGEFLGVMRWKDMQGAEGCGEMKLADDELEKIMHIALPIGDKTVLMGFDGIKASGQTHIAGNNFSIAVGADSKEELETLFNRMADGATVTMPLGDAFWGAYFGMLTDRFGIQWMFNYDYNSK